MQPTQPVKRQPLSRSAVVAAAVALADAEGVAALTMRELARRLGYEVMSLYNHVANKGELLALMVDSVADEISGPPADGAPVEAVRAIAVSTRNMFINHGWAADLWLRHLPGPARIRQMENLLQALSGTGLAPDLAHHGFHAVNNHVLGYTIQEIGMMPDQYKEEDPEALAKVFLSGLSETDHPLTAAHVRQHIDGKATSSFELVLDLILDGLVRLNANR